MRFVLNREPKDNSPLARWIRVPGLPQRPLTTDTQHAHGGLVQLDEHAIVDLPQAKQLQNLFNLEYRVEGCNYERFKTSTAREGVLMAARIGIMVYVLTITLGETWLIPRIRITKANLGSPATW